MFSQGRRLLALVGSLFLVLAGTVGLFLPASAAAGQSQSQQERTTETVRWKGGGQKYANLQCQPGQTAVHHWRVTSDERRSFQSGQLTVSYADGSTKTVEGTIEGLVSPVHFDTKKSSPAVVTDASATVTYAGSEAELALAIVDGNCTGEPNQENHALRIAKDVEGDAPDDATYKAQVSCNPDVGIDGTYTLVPGKPQEIPFTAPAQTKVSCTITEVRQGGASTVKHQLCGANCTSPIPGDQAKREIRSADPSGTSATMIFVNIYKKDQPSSGGDQQQPGGSEQKGEVTVQTGNGGTAQASGSGPLQLLGGLTASLLALGAAGFAIRRWKPARQ